MGVLPARRVTALILGGLLTFAANLPPEHGHPSAAGRAAIVHRHASLHVAGNPAHPRLSDSDGLVIWIDGSYLSAASATVPRPDAIAVSPVVHGSPQLRVMWVCFDSQATGIHGPPGYSFGLRGPPSPSAL
jgi:hypothetical protein